MSANGDAARRDMWAGRIERCLSANMTIKEWCGLNKVSESNLYRWMACFREEEPGSPPQVQQGVRLGESHPRRHRRRQGHRPGRRCGRERALGARRGGDPRRGGRSRPSHTRAGGPRRVTCIVFSDTHAMDFDALEFMPTTTEGTAP